MPFPCLNIFFIFFWQLILSKPAIMYYSRYHSFPPYIIKNIRKSISIYFNFTLRKLLDNTLITLSGTIQNKIFPSDTLQSELSMHGFKYSALSIIYTDIKTLYFIFIYHIPKIVHNTIFNFS